MPTITDLDDLSVSFDDRGTPTLIDPSITLPDELASMNGFNFVMNGLQDADRVSFLLAQNDMFTLQDTVLNATIPGIYAGTVGQMVTGPGFFNFYASLGVPKAVFEMALERLAFSTTDSATYSTRTIEYRVASGLVSANPTVATSTITIGEAPVTLADLAPRAVFTAGSFDMGAALLDSDVSVTVAERINTVGTVLSVSGLVEGDSVNLRMQGAGSPFAITQDPTLPEGAYRLFLDGDQIGIVGFGYDNGAARMPFRLQFTAPVTAATIETVIENLQFATGAASGARTLTVALSEFEAIEPLVSKDISVLMVPEIGGVADEIWIDTANANGPLFRMSDVPSGDYSGATVTISGLIGRIDLPSLAPGMFSMDNIHQTQGDTLNVYWYSERFATITLPAYHDTGDLVIDFIMSGTSSTLAEAFLNELRFNPGSSVAFGFDLTRELTITVETAQDGVVAQSMASLTYGQPALTDLESPDRIRAGEGPALLDDDVTVTVPAGFTADGARIEVTGLAAGDVVSLSDSGPFSVDGEGNLILSNWSGQVTIGTFAAGSSSYGGQSGDLVSTPAVIELNENAPSWVLETLIENLTLESTGRFSTDRRTLDVSLYNADGHRWTSVSVDAAVTGNNIAGLKNIHYNEGAVDIYNAPFVDTSVSLAPGDYSGWTLEVSAANGALGDTVWIGTHIIGNRHFELLSQPDQSITLFYVNEFGQPSPVGSYIGLTNRNGIGSGFRIEVAESSTWTADRLEHLIESVTMLAGGPDGTASSVTYTLSNPQGVFYQDTVHVVKTGPVAALEGLVPSITVNLALTALDGPVLIDSDLQLPQSLSAGLFVLTVEGQEAGDLLNVRTSETPAVGELGVSGGLLYRQLAGETELLGYVSGGEGTPLRVEFLRGVTTAQIETVVEALTFNSKSTIANRELAITLLQDGVAASRGFVDVNLDRTPLIADLSRVVKFDAATIATTPMVIDSDVSLPEDMSYGRSSIDILRPYEVRIGVGEGYRVVTSGANDAYVYLGESVVAYWYTGSTSSYFSFAPDATRAVVEGLLESLTFTSTITDAPSKLTISLSQSLDSVLSTVARSEVLLRPAVGDQILTGSEVDDTLTGDEGHDLLTGLGGNDLLVGLAGRDTLVGGEGDDLLQGNGWRDRLEGNAGNDTLQGNRGSDVLIGGGGDDALQGGFDDDRMFGGAGKDTLTGGVGNDELAGGLGDDRINGGEGSDTLEGGAGADTLLGGVYSADTIVFGLEDVGKGVDVIWNFEQGDDVLELSVALINQLESMGGSAMDAISWDDATDTLSLDFAAVGLRGGLVAIARFVGDVPSQVTAADFVFS